MQSARYEIPSDFILTYDAFQVLLKMAVEDHCFIPDCALMARERYEALRQEALMFDNVHHCGMDDVDPVYEQLYLLNRAVPGFDIRIVRKDMALTKIAFVAHW